MKTNGNHNIVWAPQPGPQKALIDCPVYEIFYGGARGGGKTDGMLGKFAIKASRYGAGVKGVFFRRELTQLDEAIARSHEIYRPLGAEWQDQKKVWTFPGGATLKFRYLERDADAEKYQGHSYTDLFFEELTNFPDPKPVMKLKATLRSPQGIPVQFHGTGNPGGPGHNWVKARYIDPAPQGFKILKEHDLYLGLEQKRVFIPAKVQDNRILVNSDPGYIARLAHIGNEALVKAWLEGDWNVIEGAFFDCWSPKMVIRPFALPEHWTRFRSMDWGSAKPFSIGWWALASEDTPHPDGFIIPQNGLVRWREWYGSKEPDVGLKLTAEEVGEGILEREQRKRASEDPYSNNPADPSIFAQDGGPSIAERQAVQGVRWAPADNKRTAREGHMGGWDHMRQRMKGQDNRPMIFCFETCSDSIRTIPVLQHDQNKPEDLDTTAEDHAADEWRYACMSRQMPTPKPEPMPDDTWAAPTAKQIHERYMRR